MQITSGISKVKKRLNNVGCEHFIFLPQIQNSNYTTLLLIWTFIQMVKSHLDIFGKSGCKYIFGCSELMSGLSYNRINYIKSWNFVLWSALLDEFFNTLNHMLVIFDGTNGTFSDSSHLSFGNRRLDLVQRRELKN